MSVVKLLSRIVAPQGMEDDGSVLDGSHRETALSRHDHTYGITSDPLVRSLLLDCLCEAS